MAYYISTDCMGCGICEDFCPVDAISEGEGSYEINQKSCTACGICENECPTDCIEEIEEL